MRRSKIGNRIIFGLFAALALSLFIPQAVFCQKEKLGIVRYTPPKGWTKSPPTWTKTTSKRKKTKQENFVTYGHKNETTGSFCVITLNGATDSTGVPYEDFDALWSGIVDVEPLNTAAAPRKLPPQTIEGLTLIAGGSEIDFNGRNTKIILTVFSGLGKAFSVLVMSDDKSYMPQIEAFIESIEVVKTTAKKSKTRAFR